jgi:hypothetical protein
MLDTPVIDDLVSFSPGAEQTVMRLRVGALQRVGGGGSAQWRSYCKRLFYAS